MPKTKTTIKGSKIRIGKINFFIYKIYNVVFKKSDKK